MPVHAPAGTPREIGYGSCSPDFLVSEEAVTRTVYIPRAVVITFFSPAGNFSGRGFGKKKTEKAEGREGGRQWPAGLDSKLPPSKDCKGCTFVTNMAPCVSEDTANHIPSTEISERPTVSNELHGRKSSAQENIYITISVMCCGLYLYLQTKTSSCLDNWPRKFAPKGLISRENILYPQN